MLDLGNEALRNMFWPMLLLPLVVLAVKHRVIEREEQYLEASSAESICSTKHECSTGYNEGLK